jgi:uncharacterized protein (UPF0264 family)
MLVLISSVSCEEAAAILHTGVDIIDAKNVQEGSLGAQFPWKTRAVVEMARSHPVRVSATLGDLPFKPGTAALAAYAAAQVGVTYVKAGLHGLNTYDQALAMMVAVRQAVRMTSATADVVAAGYADFRRFGGLSTQDLVRAARDAECTAVMVDTAIKDGKTLFDNMCFDEIRAFVDQAREARLMVALAGSIKFEHADMLLELAPDLIGVRGAVCSGADRALAICPEKTRRFVDHFHGRSPARHAAGRGVVSLCAAPHASASGRRV